LIDEQGRVVSTGSTELTLSTPHPLWSEQDPAEWWEGTVKSIRQALDQAGVSGKTVSAVGMTGQMHGLVLLDEQGRVLRPAILWNDQRTAAQCEEITRRVGAQQLLEITGNRALTGFTVPNPWVRENEPKFIVRLHILLPMITSATGSRGAGGRQGRRLGDDPRSETP
jgi:xylulokinase